MEITCQRNISLRLLFIHFAHSGADSRYPDFRWRLHAKGIFLAGFYSYTFLALVQILDILILDGDYMPKEYL